MSTVGFLGMPARIRRGLAYLLGDRRLLGHAAFDWVVLLLGAGLFLAVVSRRLRYREAASGTTLWLLITGASLVLATAGFVHDWRYTKEICSLWTAMNGEL